MCKNFILFGNNQSNFKCPFKCRGICSPKPFTVSDPVHMLTVHLLQFTLCIFQSEWVTVALKPIFTSRLCLHVSASFCGLVGLCVFVGFVYGSKPRLRAQTRCRWLLICLVWRLWCPGVLNTNCCPCSLDCHFDLWKNILESCQGEEEQGLVVVFKEKRQENRVYR